jgi:hypothetical protein
MLVGPIYINGAGRVLMAVHIKDIKLTTPFGLTVLDGRYIPRTSLRFRGS